MELLIKLLQTDRLLDKWWSAKIAKNQGYGFMVTETRH